MSWYIFFGLPSGTKYNMDKISVFYRSEWNKVLPHENEFWLFSIRKMNVTGRAEKVDEKVRLFG